MESTSFDLLHALIAVAEAPNFRAAAERLGLSQPAITLKMRQLEELHPNPVFVLEGRRKVLTRYGRELYERAKAGTHRLDHEIEDLKRRYASPKDLKVRIGGRIDVLLYVAKWLEFEGRIEMIDLSSSAAVQALLKHDIDIAITYSKPDSATLQAKHLFRSHAYLRVHKKWLADRSSKSLLKDIEFLRTTPCFLYRNEGHLLVALLRPLGLKISDLNVKYVCESWSLIQSFVNDGIGYSVLPFYASEVSPDVRSFEIPASINEPLDYYAVFELGMRKMEAFKSLLSFSKLKRE